VTAGYRSPRALPIDALHAGAVKVFGPERVFREGDLRTANRLCG
jgi:hypothetical protein